jgi:hypothetical protein
MQCLIARESLLRRQLRYMVCYMNGATARPFVVCHDSHD